MIFVLLPFLPLPVCCALYLVVLHFGFFCSVMKQEWNPVKIKIYLTIPASVNFSSDPRFCQSEVCKEVVHCNVTAIRQTLESSFNNGHFQANIPWCSLLVVAFLLMIQKFHTAQIPTHLNNAM